MTSPLLTMPPRRAVWTVAWPMIALGWVRGLYLVADTWWVGHLGTPQLTGVAAASFGWWILHHLAELPALGVHAQVARLEGAGARDRVATTLAGGLVVGATLAAVTVLGHVVALPAYLDAIGVPAGDGGRAHAAAFLGAAVFVLGGTVLAESVSAVWRGLGDTRTALAITGAGLVANLVLDPLLIWGVGPVPALGVAGAAWATGLADLVTALVGLALLARRGIGRPERPGLPLLARIVGVGAPMASAGVAFALIYVVLGRWIAEFGPAHLAALGIGHRVESFAFLTAVGLGVAASTLVGQHLGAGQPDAALHRLAVVRRGADLATLLIGVVAFVWAKPIYALFVADVAVQEAGVAYLRWQAAVWVFMGWTMVYEGAFTGAGRTLAAMSLGGALIVMRLPLAAALAWSAGMGVDGIWAAIAIQTVVQGVALRALFHARFATFALGADGARGEGPASP